MEHAETIIAGGTIILQRIQKKVQGLRDICENM